MIKENFGFVFNLFLGLKMTDSKIEIQIAYNIAKSLYKTQITPKKGVL